MYFIDDVGDEVADEYKPGKMINLREYVKDERIGGVMIGRH